MATTRSKPKPEPKPRPILALDTLAPERPFITVDDVRHDFRLMQEFGAIEHARFTRDSREYDELYSGDGELDKAAGDRMVALLESLVDTVLVDAGKLREQAGERLTGAMKREILLAFTNAPLLMAAMAQQTEMEARESSTTAS